MTEGTGKRLDWGNLRRRAEQRLRERKEAANLALRDPERVVHELEVHHVELEIQNEELRESRLELESALARYTEIFDFAPIGYVTITVDADFTGNSGAESVSIINQANSGNVITYDSGGLGLRLLADLLADINGSVNGNMSATAFECGSLHEMPNGSPSMLR